MKKIIEKKTFDYIGILLGVFFVVAIISPFFFPIIFKLSAKLMLQVRRPRTKIPKSFFILKYYHPTPFVVHNSEHTLNTLLDKINVFYEN